MKEDILNSLRQSGICAIKGYVSSGFCSQAVADLEDAISKFPEKVQSSAKEETSGDSRIFKMENHYETAKFFAEDPFLLDVCSSYMNYPIKSHFVLGGKVSYQSSQTTNSGGGWHRDNAQGQIKTIIYLSDVEEKNGPFLFLPSSNQYELEKRNQEGATRYSDEVVNNFCKSNKIEPHKVTGPKATVIFADTSFIHRGENIKGGSRYSYTNYYFEDTTERSRLCEEKWGEMYI
tara:strand:- start:7 stop:705 length:699 start_codon:yes stop_codon:yes gene_type:complete